VQYTSVNGGKPGPPAQKAKHANGNASVKDVRQVPRNRGTRGAVLQ
jgi:hypothetical protein